MRTLARFTKQAQDLVGNIVKVDVVDESCLILYINNDDTDKYYIRLSADNTGREYDWGDDSTGLLMQKHYPEYGVHLTDGKGEPTILLQHVFKWELPEYINTWGAPSDEWYDRIVNGDRFYGGAHINKAVLCKVK